MMHNVSYALIIGLVLCNFVSSIDANNVKMLIFRIKKSPLKYCTNEIRQHFVKRNYDQIMDITYITCSKHLSKFI